MLRPLLAVVAALCLLAPRLAAAPPRVVETEPPTGATDVAPGPAEIRVVFDRDMTVGSHSWVGGGETFPELAGAPRWEGPRVAVLPVRLAPGRRYVVGVNGGRFTSFRGAGGEPAVPHEIAFVTAAGAAPALTPAENDEAIAALRRAIDDHYAHRDRLGLDWDALLETHRAPLRAAGTPLAFAHCAGAMLASAEDVHVWLVADGTVVPTHRRRHDPAVRPERLPALVPGYAPRNDAVATGRFEDGIGYVRIATWDRARAAELAVLDEVMAAMAEAPALVVDVRGNGGGDERLARRFAGRFVAAPRVYASHEIRDPAAPGGFAPRRERVLAPTEGAPRYRGPVAVLQGPGNASSAEAFLLMMARAPACVRVGGTSAGSSGRPMPHPLPNGVTVHLPSWRAYRPDGTPIEGRGVAPDVEVDADPAALAGGDPILDRALALLRAELSRAGR